MPRKPRALCLIKADPHYRRDAFHFGLLEAGFEIVKRVHDPQPRDALVIWNRMGVGHGLAVQFEQAGAAVIVAENGYIGSDAEGRQLYALALDHHNGAGRWHIGEPGRWKTQNIDLKPWREGGDHVLVLPQRGLGEPGVAMPASWPDEVVKRLQGVTDREIRVRQHPGRHAPQRTLEEDLENAWCAVVWGSSAGIKAICAGVPVFSDFPSWIGNLASPSLIEIEDTLCDENSREAMLNRLSWAQHSVAELTTGQPFKHLVELHRSA